jgi:hypothetical protein
MALRIGRKEMIAAFIALFIGLINILYFLVIIKGLYAGGDPKQDFVQVRGTPLTSEKFSAGVLIYFMGAISLISWVYFMYSGLDSFLARASYLLPHVLVQLGSALLSLIAGHAIIHAWKRHTTIFFVAISGAILASMFSLIAHGGEMHLMSMHVFSLFVQVVGSFFAAAVYLAGMIFVEEDRPRFSGEYRENRPAKPC